MTVLPPHSPQRKAACHCSPNPHRPCAHTPAQTAKKKAAAAKARATNAAITAKATAELRAHPPSRDQIQAAVKMAAYVSAERKAHPKKRTKAQIIGQQKAAATRLKHAKQTRPHQTHGHKPPAALPASFLANAKKSVRAQLAAVAAAKVKHHRRKAKATNPHTKALKRASKRAC